MIFTVSRISEVKKLETDPFLGQSQKLEDGLMNRLMIYKHGFRYSQYSSTILRSHIEFKPSQPESLERGNRSRN